MNQWVQVIRSSERGSFVASGRKSSVNLWMGIAAAAAGVVAVVVLVKLNDRSLAGVSVQNRLRDVQDVLADCYKKISEIEQALPELTDSDIRGNGIRFSAQLP